MKTLLFKILSPDARDILLVIPWTTEMRQSVKDRSKAFMDFRRSVGAPVSLMKFECPLHAYRMPWQMGMIDEKGELDKKLVLVLENSKQLNEVLEDCSPIPLTGPGMVIAGDSFFFEFTVSSTGTLHRTPNPGVEYPPLFSD